MEEKYLLAIEIGSSKIKGAVGVLDDGLLTVTAVEEEKISDSVRHGLILNVETVASRVNSILRKLENRVSPRKARSVYVGIGGRSFRSSPREVERQLPVEEQITAELVEQLREEALSTALDDREVVSVADGEYYVDHHLCPSPVGTYGRNIRATFNLITCRLQAMRNLKRAFADRLSLKVNATFVRQLAEAELVLSSDDRRQGCMLVDFGAETTTVSIYKHGALRYMATIPMGARNITRDIMALNHLEERAEALKVAGGNAMPGANPLKQIVDGIDFTQINNYVAARAAEIIANINEQVKYADLSVTDLPAGIIIVGGGAKLKGLKELLESVTKMKVRAGMPTPVVKIADMRINASDSIDVISALYAASRLEAPADCMTQAVKPAPAPAPAPAPEPAQAPVAEPAPEPAPEQPTEPIFENFPSDDDINSDLEIETGIHKPGRFKQWARKISVFLSESPLDEMEDDDEDDDR